MRSKPDHITAYWDTDGSPEGWAWRATWFDRDGRIEHEESGGFAGRRNLSDKMAERRAKAAAGYARSRVPVRVNH